MKLNATYIKIRDKWWGLPLFLPSLILPIFAHINTFAHISSGEVFLFYLPLALMISMMMFFSWAALPGIALGIFVRKYAELGFYETLSLTANFIIIIILCWGGYRVFTPRRNNVSHGDSRLISQRLFWQYCVSCNAVSDTFPVCCVCRVTGEQRISGRRHAL